MTEKTTVLMILDGFGITENQYGNAIYMAKKPNIDMLMEKYPYVLGSASGLDVGLPEGQMGNSEVGHLNIGAGRIVYQELTRITKEIKDGDFFQNPALLDAVKNCIEKKSSLHLYGLLSDGGVHSHNTHLYALLELAKAQGLTEVFVHAFLDGRDTAPQSGKEFLIELEEKLTQIGVGKIATVSGRYYAMDRDKRWDRVKLAYDALVYSEGKTANSALECITDSYINGINDEFVIPTVICNEGRISPNDSVIFFNFRPDRARELTRAFCDPAFDGFERKDGMFPLKYVCFTEYDITIPNTEIAFRSQSLDNTLGEYIASLGLKQLHLAETEKYAHVTFFFNGGIEEPNKNEERILVPSPKVATYDLKPEMSAPEVCDELIKAIDSREYDLIIINFANPDMVGHTGIVPAAVSAIEDIDACIGKVYSALIETDSQMFICADHGNSDKMIDYETGEPFTAHTTNPVPFILVNYKDGIKLAAGGRLCDIAPTLLEMMNLPVPKEMTGKSLLI